MNTQLNIMTEERLQQLQMIRESASAVVSESGDLKRIRALRFDGGGMAQSTWETMVNMGWPALRLKEEQGGIELGVLEYMALMEELGKGLVPEPLIETIMVASLVPQGICDQIISGETLILPIGFPHEKQTSLHIETGKINGKVSHVNLARHADAFIILLNGELYLVDAKDPNITLDESFMHDGGNQAVVTFTQVPTTLLPHVEQEFIFEKLDEAALAHASYFIGVMQSAFDRTLEYIKVRKQFGRIIGTYQVLQHRAVDMKIAIEITRAIVNKAAEFLEKNSNNSSGSYLSAALVLASKNALEVCHDCIQMHGGIGYTDEADIGLFLRKIMALFNQYGTASYYKKRYMKHYAGE